VTFALVAMLGLLGLRIFKATGADIADLGENMLTGCCALLNDLKASCPRRSI
jgi:hypothetical protein